MDLPSRTMGSLATLVGWTLEGRLLLVSHWVVRPRIKTAYGTVLLLAKEGLGTSWRGGCRRPPGCCCWLPSRGLKFIDREETVDAILVRHQAPGPPSRPIVGRRPSPPALPLFVPFWTNLQTFWNFEHPAPAPASEPHDVPTTNPSQSPTNDHCHPLAAWLQFDRSHERQQEAQLHDKTHHTICV